MKRVLLVCLAVLMLLAVSCGKKVEEVEYKEAEASVSEFLQCIEGERYEDAVKLMHPGFFTEAGEIQYFLESKEYNWGIDFSDGFSNIVYKKFEPAYYDDSFSGSFYRLSGTAKIGKNTVSFYFDVAKFNDEFGISNFDFNLTA